MTGPNNAPVATFLLKVAVSVTISSVICSCMWSLIAFVEERDLLSALSSFATGVVVSMAKLVAPAAPSFQTVHGQLPSLAPYFEIGLMTLVVMLVWWAPALRRPRSLLGLTWARGGQSAAEFPH